MSAPLSVQASWIRIPMPTSRKESRHGRRALIFRPRSRQELQRLCVFDGKSSQGLAHVSM